LPDKPFGASDNRSEMYSPEVISDYLYETGIDSSYACVYYPWIKYDDKDNSQYIFLPPTKDVVRNLAILDNSVSPWFAPAGKNRGDVDCVEARMKTRLEDEDVLYDGRINAIKTFTYDGSYIWGQKTLQLDDNYLDRISTRRLLNHIKKGLANSCRNIIFEPNDEMTKDKLTEAITTIMGDVQANRGVSEYKYEIGDTLGNEIPCKIWLKPISALEYIPIDLILTQNGLEFSD